MSTSEAGPEDTGAKGADQPGQSDDTANATDHDLAAISARTPDEEAESTIKSYVIASMAFGMVPVFGLDVAAIVATQLKMVHSLTRIYGVSFERDLARNMIVSLVGGVLPVALGASATSLLKLIPGFGSLGGGVGLVILAGASTYAVGHVFKEHLAGGETLLTFEPAKMRGRFRTAFKRGKDVARDMQASGEAGAGADTTSAKS